MHTDKFRLFQVTIIYIYIYIYTRTHTYKLRAGQTKNRFSIFFRVKTVFCFTQDSRRTLEPTPTTLLWFSLSHFQGAKWPERETTRVRLLSIFIMSGANSPVPYMP